MAKRSVGLVLGFLFVTLLAGCKTVEVKKPSAPINKVALVSLSVTNWGGSATGTAGTMERAGKLIDGTLAGLLAETEKKLSGFMQITKVSGFVANPAYRSLNVKNDLDAMVPKVNGTPMAVFTNDNSELIAAALKPDVAKKLCSDLKVDAVVVVYSEWSYSQGGFVPLRRALAKNVVSVWDRSGNLVFNKRVDETGSGVLGGPYGPIVVNEGTIKQWGGAYTLGFNQIADEMKTTLKP
jgi:hypothetical protein